MKIKSISIFSLALILTLTTYGCSDKRTKSTSLSSNINTQDNLKENVTSVPESKTNDTNNSSNNEVNKTFNDTNNSSNNEVNKTLIYTKNINNVTSLLLCSMFNDVYLKESDTSTLKATLTCISEGKNKDSINEILKTIKLNLDEENNQYTLNLYRNNENLIISTKEMIGINYIKFNLVLEIPSKVTSIDFGNFGSVKFDNLNLDKIKISARGDIIGNTITSKDCSLFANDDTIQINKLNCNKLTLRTHKKLKATEINSKECTLLTKDATVEVNKFNCDKIYK